MDTIADGADGIDDGEFGRATERYRRELIAYCYRILGSAEDAEDVVQGVYLEAWRAYDRFEGRSSVRTWLYRIATRAAMKESRLSKRRPLPSDLTSPSADAQAGLALEAARTRWLEPLPDAIYGGASVDPATVYSSRATMRLAFIAALQHLPARQRVVLILRDVLGWSARETADLLGSTVAAVNSALQRARTRMPVVGEELAEPTEPEVLALLDRYVAAFESADIAGLLSVLTEDAAFEMPPVPFWFTGRDRIGTFLGARMIELGSAVARVTSANGQPAVALWVRDRGDAWRAHAIHVLTIAPTGITRVVAFQTPALFDRFGFDVEPPDDGTVRDVPRRVR
jgi:RNA polymerase sigma-70 factor (ECF subfamily)